MSTTLLIIPGYGGSGVGHWQSHWENEYQNIQRVEQQNWEGIVWLAL